MIYRRNPRDYVTVREHLEILEAERDRRYAEVNIEKEKAIKIKEEGDRRALELQAETQKYKDEKADDLRNQIEQERGNYATKDDLTVLGDKLEAIIGPLRDYVITQRGSNSLRRLDTSMIISIIVALAFVLTFLIPHLK